MFKKIPISLITGSLGSGKTTLLRNILSSADRKIAVLMNEFGEISIDSKIIKGDNIEIIELSGGCVCCSMTGELDAAVKELIEKIHPDLIILEATGVAEADALVYEVEDSLSQVRLDSVICLVDAYITIKFPQLGYVTGKQIEAADILLINKVDLISEQELHQVQGQVKKINPNALVFRTDHCLMDYHLLFDLNIDNMNTVVKRVMERSEHSHNQQFDSFIYTSNFVFDRERFEMFVAELPLCVYRAKGFVEFDEGFELFNYVMRRVDFEPFQAFATELVFIGPGLKQYESMIREKLKECQF